jgi:hypothetical protein
VKGGGVWGSRDFGLVGGAVTRCRYRQGTKDGLFVAREGVVVL